MKLAHVKIRNVLGIDSIDFSANRFVRIEGDNGAGKSSILAAIKGALGRGDQAELIRNGATSAEVVLLFDSGHELTMRANEKGTQRKVRTPDGATFTASQEWIAARLNPMSFNPVAFIQASNEQRIEQLLKVAKLSLSHAELARAVDIMIGLDGRVEFSEDGKSIQRPLEAIASCEKAIYDHRTGLNRSAKDKRGHIAELERTLPPVSGQAVDTSSLKTELDGIRGRAKSEKEQIQNAAAASRNAANVEASNAEREANNEYQAKLKAIVSRKADALAEINRSEKTDLEALQARLGPRAEELREQLGKTEAETKEYARAENTRSIIRSTTEAAEAMEREAAEATAALDRLEVLRESLLHELPVKGLEIREGKLLFKGVAFNTLNEAARVRVAMELAAASAGELRLICVDGLERLGKKERASLEKWAKSSDAQFFITRVVDDSPLSVFSEGESLSSNTQQA